tara:strand:+ start:68 stop:325 length:258 start_codon:yes stop_codon:yes gene_type:complete
MKKVQIIVCETYYEITYRNGVTKKYYGRSWAIEKVLIGLLIGNIPVEVHYIDTEDKTIDELTKDMLSPYVEKATKRKLEEEQLDY